MSKKNNNIQIPALSVNLTKLRSQFRLTQDELVEKLIDLSGGLCSITGVTLAAYEQGNRLPSLNVLYWICKLFNISFDTLLGLSPSGEPYLTENAVPEDDADVIPQCGRRINAKDLYKYDTLPVYVKTTDYSIGEGWAVFDYPNKRFIFSTGIYPYSQKVEVYAYPPKESQYMNGKTLTPLTLTQVLNESIVWVDMLGAEPYTSGRYNGWYKHNEDHSALINVSNSLTLLYGGIGIAFNAYKIEYKN